ncbi:hypothetical protein NC653_011780 [Populus alba x Populus x berolinensis]|nr:hypothetical protein NC653_011780 [Populus alba x Populus x berolinensis]
MLQSSFTLLVPIRSIAHRDAYFSEEDWAMDEPVARASDFQYELPRDRCSCWLCCRDCVESLNLQAF